MRNSSKLAQMGQHSKPTSTWKAVISAHHADCFDHAGTPEYDEAGWVAVAQYVQTGDDSCLPAEIDADLAHRVKIAKTFARNESQSRRIWKRKLASHLLDS